MLLRVDVAEELGARHLAAVHQRVRGHIVVALQIRARRGRQRVPRSARVGEVGGAAGARGGQARSAQQGEGGAARVEGRVDVEEGVAFG